MWRLFLILGLVGCGATTTPYLGQPFLGTAYQDSPLGEAALPDDDPLIRFDAFDCTTFVETVLADGDLDTLNQIRYQDGKVGFLTRNHFIETDWLTNNADIVQNVSAQYAPTETRTVLIDKSNWFKVMHGLDVDVPITRADIEYIPYRHTKGITVSRPMIVLFITDNAKIRDKIGTDLAVVHMGFVLPNGMLRHASSSQGMVVDVNMDEYITKRMKMAGNLGIALVEIK